MQITDIKRQALKILGITNADISNYRADRKKHISKKHWKILELVMKHEVIEADKFSPFNRKLNARFVILLPFIVKSKSKSKIKK